MQVSTVERERAGTGWRVLGVLLALALAFACAVMVAVMLDIGGTKPCGDVTDEYALAHPGGECFEGSGFQKAVFLVLGWPSGVIAGVAGVLALAFAITGRSGRRMLLAAALAIVLGALSFLIGGV